MDLPPLNSSSTFIVGNKELSAREVLNLEPNFGKTFRTIAAFSLINSILNFFEAGIVFPIGLAASQIVDAILFAFKEEITNQTHLIIISVICLSINIIFSLIFYGFYRLSSVERRYVHIIGMLVYLADTGLCLLFKDYVTAAFHGFFLFLLLNEFNLAPVIVKAKAYVASRQDRRQVVDQSVSSPPTEEI